MLTETILKALEFCDIDHKLEKMWCKTHSISIPNVSGLIYNTHMDNELLVRCNWCYSLFEYEVVECNICLTDYYLMDMSVPSDTITNINERI